MNHKLLNINQIRLFDDSDLTRSNIAQSFATDDTLCLSVSETNETAIRFWVHEPTVVFGIPDSRLPYFEDGIHYLREQGYKCIIRNSGGLAVLLDEGILNMSLIFPDSKQYDIHDGYQALVSFIKGVFSEETDQIEAYEIEQSYCPGTYDLSIGGKKFAGISQRRVKNGSAVQIYLCVEGSGAKRADVIKQFYDLARKDEATKFTYPDIEPSVMASLEELLDRPLTVRQVIRLVHKKLNKTGITINERPFNRQEQAWFEQRLKLMTNRNKNLNDL